MFQSSTELQRMYPPTCPRPCSPSCFPHCDAICCTSGNMVNTFTRMFQQQQQRMQLPARQNIQPQQYSRSLQQQQFQQQRLQQQRPSMSSPFQMMNEISGGGGFSHCGAQCPQSCAPSCLTSCCMQSAPSPMMLAPPTQMMQPMMLPQCPGACPTSCAPSCLPSCCSPPPPPMITQPICPASCPATCAPSCLPSCCGQQQSMIRGMTSPQISNVPALQSAQIDNPNSCPAYCPDHCLPDCTQKCCDPSSIPSTNQVIDKKSKISKIAAQLAMLRRKRSIL